MQTVQKTIIVLVFSAALITFGISQTADGFTSYSVNLEFKLQPGETQMLEWGIINDNGKKPLHLEMFASGQGAELFVFEEDIVIEPGTTRQIEIFVIVPEDYPTDLELHPEVYARQVDPIKSQSGEGASINMIMQHVTKPIILIGDNPVYYAPEVIEEVIPDITTNEEAPTPAPKVESIPGETMQEKLDRIKAANEADQVMQEMEEIEVDVIPDTDPEPYIPEPIDVEEIEEVEEKIECDFFAWFLSLFGFGKC